MIPAGCNPPTPRGGLGVEILPPPLPSDWGFRSAAGAENAAYASNRGPDNMCIRAQARHALQTGWLHPRGPTRA